MRLLYILLSLLQLLSTAHGITHSELKLLVRKTIEDYTGEKIRESVAGYLKIKLVGTDPQKGAEEAVAVNISKEYKADRVDRPGCSSAEHYLFSMTLETLKKVGDETLGVGGFTKWIGDGLGRCREKWEGYEIDRAGVGINFKPITFPNTGLKTKSFFPGLLKSEPEIDWDWANIAFINSTINLNIFRNTLPPELPVEDRSKTNDEDSDDIQEGDRLEDQPPQVTTTTTALPVTPQPGKATESNGHNGAELAPENVLGDYSNDSFESVRLEGSDSSSSSVGSLVPAPTEKQPVPTNSPVGPTTSGNLSNFPSPLATPLSDPPLRLTASQLPSHDADGVRNETVVPIAKGPQQPVSSQEGVRTASGPVPDQGKLIYF